MLPRRLHLIAYDIADSRRRARALKAIQAFGVDGQKSAHECVLAESERRELVARLRNLIDPATDRALIVRLDPRGAIRKLGRNVEATASAKAPLAFVIG